MRRISIITATRAEYGLLTPLIKKVAEDDDLELDLIVTGTHLSPEYGYTIEEIQKDGFLINHEIPILEKDNTPYGVSMTMANAIKRFAKCFHADRPDMAVILGDRTEMLGVASAAMNERIPIAHIHGGEVTEGAVDDCVRHALTKMSYLHFTSTDLYRNRVIQLGESPGRVFNVGGLGTENILRTVLIKEEVMRKEIGIPHGANYSVVTYHPMTLGKGTARDEVNNLCRAMKSRPDIFFLITAANADAGSREVNRQLSDYCVNQTNGKFVNNLGMKLYLSAVKHGLFVMGNSSSGILEAPVLGTPTINIGDRQKGRMMAKSVINCSTDERDIVEAMKKAEKAEHYQDGIYGDGTASIQILEIIKKFLNEGINLKKGFYDLGVSSNEFI